MSKIVRTYLSTHRSPNHHSWGFLSKPRAITKVLQNLQSPNHGSLFNSIQLLPRVVQLTFHQIQTIELHWHLLHSAPVQPSASTYIYTTDFLFSISSNSTAHGKNIKGRITLDIRIFLS